MLERFTALGILKRFIWKCNRNRRLYILRIRREKH